MVRFAVYAASSVVAAVAVIVNAYVTKHQYYSTVLLLVTSNLSKLVLGNAFFVMAVLMGQLTRAVFLGTLREVEVEDLHDRSWYAVTETCLALTIFREDFSMRLMALFTLLLFMKTFHWLSQDRVDYFEQSPHIPVSAHIRVVVLVILLWMGDVFFLCVMGLHMKWHGISVLLLFAFEFLILSIMDVATLSKYVIHLYDLRRDGLWENRGLWMFYLNIGSESLSLIVYATFFIIAFFSYGPPLHIIRDIYVTFRSLRKRIADFLHYRRITANMNELLPDATEEQLQNADRICIVCREEMAVAKALPCGHIFHLHCLRSWLERQQNCPTCRRPILPENPPPPPPPPPQAPPVIPQPEQAQVVAPPPPPALWAQFPPPPGDPVAQAAPIPPPTATMAIPPPPPPPPLSLGSFLPFTSGGEGGTSASPLFYIHMQQQLLLAQQQAIQIQVEHMRGEDPLWETAQRQLEHIRGQMNDLQAQIDSIQAQRPQGSTDVSEAEHDQGELRRRHVEHVEEGE